MRIIYTLIIILIYNIGFSQNLIYNGSIEELDSNCVYTLTRPYNPWNGKIPAKNLFNIIGSPDAFNECAPIINYTDSMVNVPSNIFGYQYARTGKGIAHNNIGSNYILNITYHSEILSLPLKQNLIAGKKYCIQFYTVRSNIINWATDNISAALSVDSIALVFDYIDIQSIITNMGKGIITDTVNWIQVKDTIIATGIEKYLHIGHLLKTHSNNLQYIYTPAADNNPNLHYLLYYIDDVALWSCDTVAPRANAGNDTVICKGESVLIGTHNYNDYYYSWWQDSICGIHGISEIQRDEHLGQIWVTPNKSTWYYLQATDFKFDKSIDSVFVEVNVCKCAIEDTAICLGDSVALGLNDPFFSSYVWSPNYCIDNINSPSPIVNSKHSLWYYATAYDTLGGSISDSVYITIKNCKASNNDTTICLGTELSIGNNNPLYNAWFWFPTDYLSSPTVASPIASPPYDITYFLSATDTFGAVTQDTINIVVEDCDKIYDLLIPSAFTPNNDGLNDEFAFGNYQYWQFTTYIYNRWGQLVFEGKNTFWWDGKYKYQPAPEGIYIYKIKGKAAGIEKEWMGNVTLLR